MKQSADAVVDAIARRQESGAAAQEAPDGGENRRTGAARHGRWIGVCTHPGGLGLRLAECGFGRLRRRQRLRLWRRWRCGRRKWRTPGGELAQVDRGQVFGDLVCVGRCLRCTIDRTGKGLGGAGEGSAWEAGRHSGRPRGRRPTRRRLVFRRGALFSRAVVDQFWCPPSSSTSRSAGACVFSSFNVVAFAAIILRAARRFLVSEELELLLHRRSDDGAVDGRCARPHQGRAARVHRGAGRAHVIDQQDGSSAYGFGLAHAKGPGDVRGAAVSVESRLMRRVADSLQRERPPLGSEPARDATRKERRLIEASFREARDVKGYRNDHGITKARRVSLESAPEEIAEGTGEVGSVLVLQPGDGLRHRTAVDEGCGQVDFLVIGALDRRRASPAEGGKDRHASVMRRIWAARALRPGALRARPCARRRGSYPLHRLAQAFGCVSESSAAERGLARGEPLFAGHGEEDVVFPIPRNRQVPLGDAFAPVARLFEHAKAAGVARHDRSLNAVKPGGRERE